MPATRQPACALHSSPRRRGSSHPQRQRNVSGSPLRPNVLVGAGCGGVRATNAVLEAIRNARGDRIYTENDEPQPQVVLAFGLRITNWAPLRPSV